MSRRAGALTIGVLAIGGGAWWWQGSPGRRDAAATPTALATRAAAVLRDLAGLPGQVSWGTSHGVTPAQPPYATSVAVDLHQAAPLTVDVLQDVVVLEGPTWTIRVNTALVTELRCTRSAPVGHPVVNLVVLAGTPEPGADPDAAAPTLLSVDVADERRFRQLCVHHQLPLDD